MNGKNSFFLYLALAITCSGCVYKSTFPYLEVVVKSYENSREDQINEEVLLKVIEAFEEKVVTEHEPNWDRRVYYVPNQNRFFEFEQPDAIFQKYLEDKLDRIDICFSGIEIEGLESSSWRNLHLLKREIQLFEEPANIIKDGDQKCEIEIGYAFTLTPVYKGIEDKYFFVVQFGRRKYCLDSDRNLIDAYISVPGSLYPFIYFVCFSSEGEIWIKNYSW